jgi:hypothetical protein
LWLRKLAKDVIQGDFCDSEGTKTVKIYPQIPLKNQN